MPRFALSGIFLIGASLVLLAGATEGPRAVPVAKDTWTEGMAWLSSAASSAIDAARQARRRLPEKVGPPLGLTSPPATQRLTGTPAATPLATATDASPSGASPPVAPMPRPNVAPPREVAAPVASPSGASPPAAPAPRSNVTSPREAAAPTTAAPPRDPGDTQRAEVNDLRSRVKSSQMEIASLAAERDRARQELEALRQQQQTQAAAPSESKSLAESKSLEKIAASSVSPPAASPAAAPAPRSNVTSPRETAAPATAAASKDPGDRQRVEVNDLRNQVKKGQTEIASLSADRDRARQELEALRQQRQTQAAAPSESKSLEKIAASNVSPRSPVTASRVIRARQRRHSATVYRPVRTPRDGSEEDVSLEGLY